MAWTFVQGYGSSASAVKFAGDVASTTVVLPSNVTAGNVLVAYVGVFTDGTGVTVSDNRSNTWATSKRLAVPHASVDSRGEIWWVVAGTTASTTVTFQRTGGTYGWWNVYVAEYNVGNATVSQITTASATQDSNTTSHSSGATSGSAAAGDLVLGMFFRSTDALNPSPSDGKTLRGAPLASGSMAGALSENLSASAGTQSAAFTLSTADAGLTGCLVLRATSSGTSVAPTGIATAQAFGTATVSPGAVTVTASGIATAETFGTPRQTAFLSPSSIASAEAVSNVVLSGGSVAVAPTAIGSAQGFGTLSVITAGSVAANGIASAQGIGTPIVSGGTQSNYPLFSNSYAGTTNVQGIVTPVGIPSEQTMGWAFFKGDSFPGYGNSYAGAIVFQVVGPVSILSQDALGRPVVLRTGDTPPAPPGPPPGPLPVAYLPVPPAREVLLEVRAPDLTRVGMIDPRDIVEFQAVLRYQNLGSWALRLQPNHPMSAWLSTPKAGLIASLDGEVLFSGPVDGGNNFRSREVANGRMVFTGVDDSYILGDALAYPQPSNSNASTQTAAYDTRTGAAETVMHAYVNANIGPSAPVARRVSDLTMAANLGRGQAVTHKARFEVLGELLETIGKLAGLGFRVRQNGLTREFEVYQPRDLTAAIRFDIFNDTLVSHEYGWGVHKVSRAIVAGGGEGTARVIVERTTTDSLAAESLWGRRIERFIDQRQTEEVAELQQAGDEALVEDGKTRTGIEIEPVDTYQVQFARDYYLGDKVTVTVDNIEIQDTITEVEITLNRDGFNAKPTLGQLTTISRHSQLRLLSSQHEQARRLSGLERKV